MRLNTRVAIPRGASTVEYALILVAVILLAAGSFKLLGGKVGTRSGSAGDAVSAEGAGPGKGGGDGRGGGGGGGAKITVSDKSNVTSKVSVGGGGGGEQGGATSNRDTSSESNAVASANNKDSGGNADVTENFTPKRWMGIGLLAAGVIAIGYVIASLRRTKKAADDAGGKDDPSPLGRRSRKK